MKTLIGIPTRDRLSAPMLAHQFCKYGDVIIVARGVELEESPDYGIIYQNDSDRRPGLCNARNRIFREAMAGGYNIVVQCDDDLGFKPGVLNAFFAHVHDLLPRGVSSVCSRTRLYEFWDGPCASNMDYEIRPRMLQLYALRVETVRKLGLFDLDTCEDLEYALRLISHGLIPVQLCLKGLAHDHLIARLKKKESGGGQSVVERMSLLDNALASINARYDFAVSRRKGESSLSTKVDWKKIAALIPDLGLGYADKRGIRA